MSEMTILEAVQKRNALPADAAEWEIKKADKDVYNAVINAPTLMKLRQKNAAAADKHSEGKKPEEKKPDGSGGGSSGATPH